MKKSTSLQLKSSIASANDPPSLGAVLSPPTRRFACRCESAQPDRTNAMNRTPHVFVTLSSDLLCHLSQLLQKWTYRLIDSCWPNLRYTRFNPGALKNGYASGPLNGGSPVEAAFGLIRFPRSSLNPAELDILTLPLLP